MKYTTIILLLGLTLVGCATHKPTGTADDPFGASSIEGSLIEGDNQSYPQDGDRSLFAPVFFGYDSTQIKPEEIGKIEAVAKHLNRNQASGVIVEGHADERGSREYNLALGEVRALAVRDYLVSLGANAAMIQTKSYGEEAPADEGHDEQAWNQNRRVVFAIY